MLAYLFWHWPDTKDLAQYEASLVAFHQTLSSHAPSGFRGSRVYRHERVPWIAATSPAYEDWYFVTGFDALGVLNDAAVAGARRASHDRVAQRVADGAGGVYRLVQGEFTLGAGDAMVWFRKPKGMSYPNFFQMIAPTMEAEGHTLWQRQLVLGPGPEFCMAAPVLSRKLAIAGFEAQPREVWRGSPSTAA